MQYTENLNLTKYEANDPTNWLVTFNTNMDKIDSGVGNQNDQIDVIEATAETAVTTANSAVTTATEALTTAEGKTSVNDNVASATTTYSSNKIDDLISGIQPGTEIDDSVTSTTKTWSSSKINDLISDIDPIPYTGDTDNTIINCPAVVSDYSTEPNVKKLATDSITITTPGYYYLSLLTTNLFSADRKYCFSKLTCKKGNRTIFDIMKEQPKRNTFGPPPIVLTSNIYYIPANTNIEFVIYSDYFSTDSYQVELHKIN